MRLEFKNKSQEELTKELQNYEVDSTEYKATTFEIQRIQQDTNNIQIGRLLKIIEKSAETSEKSAKSNNRLSKIAIMIAVLAIVIQIIGIFFY